MGKRKGDSDNKHRKKPKNGGFIDVNTSGIYATCSRGKERACVKELMSIFEEKAKEMYPSLDEQDEESEEPEEKLSVEEQIKREVEELKGASKSKESLFSHIELNCECLIFIKTRKPIDPEEFVKSLCEEAFDSKKKTTRFTQKLTPITLSTSASVEELKKLTKKVLAPHFHKEKNQKPLKFAVQVSRRHFNTIDRDTIIRSVAECMGKEYGHQVDLKNYDKLIIVECFKTNIGMSVADDYDKLYKYNLQQIFDKATE